MRLLQQRRSRLTPLMTADRTTCKCDDAACVHSDPSLRGPLPTNLFDTIYQFPFDSFSELFKWGPMQVSLLTSVTSVVWAPLYQKRPSQTLLHNAHDINSYILAPEANYRGVRLWVARCIPRCPTMLTWCSVHTQRLGRLLLSTATRPSERPEALLFFSGRELRLGRSSPRFTPTTRRSTYDKRRP